MLACVVPISKHGSSAQHERYLRCLCDGTLVVEYEVERTLRDAIGERSGSFAALNQSQFLRA